MGPPDEGGGAWLHPRGIIWGPVGRALWVLHRACLTNFVVHIGPQRMERADAFDCGGIVHGFWGLGTGSGVEAMHPATTLQQQEFAVRDSKCGEMVPPCCQNLWVMFATVLWSAAWAGDWPYWLCQGRSLLDSSLRCALEDMSWVSTALFAVDWAGALAPLSRPAQLF